MRWPNGDGLLTLIRSDLLEDPRRITANQWPQLCERALGGLSTIRATSRRRCAKTRYGQMSAPLSPSGLFSRGNLSWEQRQRVRDCAGTQDGVLSAGWTRDCR